MSHTKEPWMAGTMPVTELTGSLAVYHCVGIEGTAKAVAITGLEGAENDAESKDDAARIAACVNACEGIPTAQLEWDSATFIDMMKERNTLEHQRDELLAALTKVQEYSGNPEIVYRVAKEAINKAGAK